MASTTSQARIDRFQQWLQAKAAPQKTANLKPGSNLLLASSLHGLARRSKGYRLTDIESIGVNVIESLTESEEEMNALGQICSEAKVAARSRSFAAINAPSKVMDLPDESPFTREQFNEQAKELGRETVLQTHIRSVRLDQVMPDGTIPETEEFSTASTTLGRGLTMFVDPGSNACSDPEVASSNLSVILEPSIFKCYRRSGELGKDEVYFTWGFGDDGNSRNAHRTGEFGSVKTGTILDFPKRPALQNGVIRKCIAGTVICWEADHSSSDWYNKLRTAMNELANLANQLSHDVGDEVLNGLIGQLPGFSEYADMVFWIENIATLIGALLDWLRNKDDKVKENNYGFSKEFLRPFKDRGEAYLNFKFDGGGQGEHSMFVRPWVQEV